MSNIKFKSIYTKECSKLAGKLSQLYSLVLSITSASSVASWAIWKQLPWLWAIIIGISQLLHIVKPHITFLKNEKDFLEMSFEYELLYLKYEKLWHDYENNKFDEQRFEDTFFSLREDEFNIEKNYKYINCPEIKRLIDNSLKQVNSAFKINFNGGYYEM